jgi:hypothetical protein
VGVKTCRKRVTEISRKLRKTSTETEKFLWKYLRNKQLRGFKFRRQQPIGRYIVDFINFEGKLIIEADGGQHSIYRKQDVIEVRWEVYVTPTTLYVETECLPPPSKGEANKVKLYRIDTPLPSRRGKKERNKSIAKFDSTNLHSRSILWKIAVFVCGPLFSELSCPSA